MTELKVGLRYGNFDPPNAQPSEPLALPVRIVDAEGTILAEGVATTGSEPTNFELPTTDDPVFVRLAWPSGRVETKRVALKGRKDGIVEFDDARIAMNEWSAWAAPRLNENMLARTDEEVPLTIDRYNRVWLRLWQNMGDRWVDAEIRPTAKFRNEAARQLELNLPPGGWLLQMGGERVPWRFVSLPSGGPCRVLLTPSESVDPRADRLKVVISGFRNGAETLLEFLSRDSLSSANALSAWAIRLLRDKFQDPVAAIIAGYYVLRVGTWRDVPEWWLANLSQSFQWLADGPLIRCAVNIRRGLQSKAAAEQARYDLFEALGRGYPLFSEGLSLLQESRAILRDSDGEANNRIEALLASRAWAGGALSFYGETPDEPRPTKIVGLPFEGRPAPRRRARSPRARGVESKLRSETADARRAADSPADLRNDIVKERRVTRNLSASRSQIVFLRDLDQPTIDQNSGGTLDTLS